MPLILAIFVILLFISGYTGNWILVYLLIAGLIIGIILNGRE